MKEFAGRVALVTGTTGIGRAIAKRFAAGAAQVIACGIDTAANEELSREADEFGLSLLVEHCDVTNLDRVRAVIAQAVSRHGGLDIIVNAAAIHPFGTVVETDLATWNRCMMVNRWQHLSSGAPRHSGDEKARRWIHHQSGIGSGICMPARRCRVCDIEGGDPQFDARSGTRPCSRQHSRQLDQPGLDPHTHAGALRSTLRAGSAG